MLIENVLDDICLGVLEHLETELALMDPHGSKHVSGHIVQSEALFGPSHKGTLEARKRHTSDSHCLEV